MTVTTTSFTGFEDPRLEARIARDMDWIAGEVAGRLGAGYRALVLGGGYGRGEGGAVPTAEGLAPYNDYDLFVVVRGISRFRMPGLRDDLHALGTALEHDIGIEVELAPVRAEDLWRLDFTMMWCELVHGHRVVDGPEDVLAAARPMPPERLPLIEGLRYLANRSALLLWALGGDLAADRVWKFVHKAWLAAGAAVLIAQGRFRVGYAARLDALHDAGIEGWRAALLRERFAEAAAARLEPSLPPAEDELARRLEEARCAMLFWWGWFEAVRTGRPVGDWREYALRDGLGETPVRSIPGNLLRQLRLLGVAGLRPLIAAAEHPSLRPVRALPALLDGQTAPELSAVLGGGGGDLPARCLELWRRS